MEDLTFYTFVGATLLVSPFIIKYFGKKEREQIQLVKRNFINLMNSSGIDFTLTADYDLSVQYQGKEVYVSPIYSAKGVNGLTISIENNSGFECELFGSAFYSIGLKDSEMDLRENSIEQQASFCGNEELSAEIVKFLRIPSVHSLISHQWDFDNGFNHKPIKELLEKKKVLWKNESAPECLSILISSPKIGVQFEPSKDVIPSSTSTHSILRREFIRGV